MSDTSNVGNAGPLAGHIEPLYAELIEHGWQPETAKRHRCLLRDLDHWAETEHPGAGLTDDLVEEFFARRRQAGFTVRYSTTGMAPVLSRLRERGLIASSPGSKERSAPTKGDPDSEKDPALAAYIAYMRAERRFARSTVLGRWYMAKHFRASLPEKLSETCADDVIRFLLGEVDRLEPTGAAKVGDGVRAFLRFLFVTGRLERDLSPLALTVRAQRRSPLPKAVDPAIVRAMLDGCDRTTAIGVRDFAILTVMVRMGLRAGEVGVMTLDDIDWEAGDVLVHGKGRRDERLPLPADVGEAITAWLRKWRPKYSGRALFVNVRSRYGTPMKADAVTRVSVRAAKRAGASERIGSHRLRHTAATEMLRSGATLREVAQVLRQSSESTTVIYAKVDRAALSVCVQSWPGSEQ